MQFIVVLLKHHALGRDLLDGKGWLLLISVWKVKLWIPTSKEKKKKEKDTPQ